MVLCNEHLLGSLMRGRIIGVMEMRRRTELRGSWVIIPDILRVISKEGEKAMKARITKGACLDGRGFEKEPLEACLNIL